MLTGVVLVTLLDVPGSAILPHGHRWLLLRSCVDQKAARLRSIGSARFGRRSGRLEQAFGRPVGRPGAKDLVFFAAVCGPGQRGEAQHRLHQQALALRRMALKPYPGIQPRAAGTD